jgi:EAL domain-containing protein (putative c-di-GMP-specific phosphodiesterase class I)
MKRESGSSSANFGEASVSELQRGRMQWPIAILSTSVLMMSGAHALERRELISDTIALSQAAKAWKSDTDCMSPPVLLIPATLGGATASPMELTDVAWSTCTSSSSMPKREAGVRHSPSSRASADVPRALTDPVAGLIATESTNTSGSPPVDSGSAFTGSAPEFSDPSPPEVNPDGAELSGCERDHACEDGAGASQAGESAQPKLKADVRPVVGTGTYVNGRVLEGIAVWLVLWLVLTYLFFRGFWILYKRHLTPDAKLIRAAKAGLKRGEFRVEYQPLVSLRDGSCVGVDALIRWDNVVYGQLGPYHYMSRIEQDSFIGPLTRFILSTAARELGPLTTKSLYIGIKVAARHVESPTFLSDVIGPAESVLSRLMLHVPEEYCARPTKRVLDAVTVLRARGVRIAMSGVTSVETYRGFHKTFRFDLLKIDRRVLALDDSERRQRLAAFVDVARELGSIVVAEGVESAIHHKVVSRSGAEFGQGFFYGRTMVLSLLVTFLNAGGSSLRGKKVRLWQ